MREAILATLRVALPFGFLAWILGLVVWPRGLGCVFLGHQLQRQKRVVLDINGGTSLQRDQLCNRCKDLFEEVEP